VQAARHPTKSMVHARYGIKCLYKELAKELAHNSKCSTTHFVAVCARTVVWEDPVLANTVHSGSATRADGKYTRACIMHGARPSSSMFIAWKTDRRASM
jgi:hypothetical protein